MPGICAVSPPSKRAARAPTGTRKATKQLLKHAGLESLAADVIEEEKRTRAENRDVVNAVVHEIHAHGVVLVHREGDFQFRADAIDTGHQHRFAHSGKTRVKQSAESADLPEHLRAVRLPNE